MAQVTFFSNKTRKGLNKYFLVFVFAVITWIFQLSIFSRFVYFDTMPNLILLGCIYFGLSFGVLPGTAFGILSSFLCASVLYDHVFYFSYPLIGFMAGLLTKNIFSDEMLLFALLVMLFTFPLEMLNGWQYNFRGSINITNRVLLISIVGTVLNLFLSPFYYHLMKFVTKKLREGK